MAHGTQTQSQAQLALNLLTAKLQGQMNADNALSYSTTVVTPQKSGARTVTMVLTTTLSAIAP